VVEQPGVLLDAVGHEGRWCIGRVETRVAAAERGLQDGLVGKQQEQVGDGSRDVLLTDDPDAAGMAAAVDDGVVEGGARVHGHLH